MMSETLNLYPYTPSKVAPILFSVLIGVSFLLHTYQNFHYRSWRVTFFLLYGNAVFLTGWVLRTLSAYNPSSLSLYIGSTICIYAGPPIYAAAEYNILGRLLHYLPMHTPLHPARVLYFFIYLGALVEGLSGAGAGQLAGAGGKIGSSTYVSGGKLLAVAIVLQGVVEVVFVSLVGVMHYRCAKAGMLASNVKIICFTLYGTSGLIVVRCVFRAVEAFTTYTVGCEDVYCGSVARHEWFLYVFEAAPMVLYTFWLNVLHPGRYLPVDKKRYLDVDGKTERKGPGWIDERSAWLTFVDPFNLGKDPKGRKEFWSTPEAWKVCEDGTFVLGTARNRAKKGKDVEGGNGAGATNRTRNEKKEIQAGG